MQLGTDKFEVYLYVADADGDCTYATEHRFLERPDAETVKVLFDEAKRHFRLLSEDAARPPPPPPPSRGGSATWLPRAKPTDRARLRRRPHRGGRHRCRATAHRRA